MIQSLQSLQRGRAVLFRARESGENSSIKATLDSYLAETFALEYREGEWDCMIFAATWADRIAGSCIVERIRGSYKTKLEGFRKWGCPPEAVRGILWQEGWRRVQTPEIGDIVTTDLQAPGIWAGDAIVALPFTASGHGFLHPRHAMEVWRCPA